MKDITFCINKECKERKSCFRAEENHSDTNSINSYAMFNCNNEKYFEPIPCRKCENYGERLLPTDVRIIQRPVEVKIECPHCFYDIEVDYSEFTIDMGSYWPEDWEGRILDCPNCEKEIEIDEVEWI